MHFYKKIISAPKLLGVLLAACLLPAQVFAAENSAMLEADDIVSAAAVLMDAETGQVLFDKGAARRIYPASTTKVMTALLVVENCSPSERVTVSESAVSIDEWNSSNIALAPGETLTVDSLLYALMLPSANDAANVLAEYVGGSQERFAEMMTARAKQIGAQNTRFANAHGLHDPQHYTTAYDMALITRYASHNEQFMQYFGAAAATIPATNLQPQARPFTNYQYMLVKETRYYDPAVLGGKVGYTREAKHTMSTVAQQTGRTLVCVVMDSTNRWEKFDDTSRLLAYGFECFRPVALSAQAFQSEPVPMGDGAVIFHAETEFTALLRNDLDESSIRVDFRFPPQFQPDAQLPSSAEVLVDSADASLPSLLGVQPLVSELKLDSVLVKQTLGSPPARASSALDTSRKRLPTSLLVAVALLCISLAAVLSLFARHLSLQRRRRARIQRLNQRIQERYHTGKSA